ncbi:lipoprotein signal peptidase [Campylobacter sp. faydin G-24]|uniref:Lipoprotein signal peptidase n=1 Tax=Campylobacter anatolicus TaxID=2829105 RepID=A0ABS5HJL1_9BACT|nr:signal peptidase II [Campylobacter anatolicus]MBR8464464.1 lipoprotein signal peptidase [Campylobacter anatolicus]MBR8466323.1 lipoprotein signal peptidase [Campylobacter anatolicus]
MRKILVKFFIAFIVIFTIDQAIKWLYVAGNGRYDGEFFSLILTYNKGVAFSMFAFLGEWLKFIQVGLIVGILGYLIREKQLLKAHTIAIGTLLGAGSSNIFDRFIHGGVVDYVFWHKWFEFAVFNLADVMIDIAIVIILWQSFMSNRKVTRLEN